MSSSYSLGLHEVGQGAYAYLQPDGGWGYSNAGLIVGDGCSLLVDTLFDLRLTEAMLESMSGVTGGAPIGTVVNTHANGDHCYGNQLVSGAEIVASSATAHEMTEVPPTMMAALNAADGDVGDLFRSFFGDFDFAGIELAPPTRTFDGRLDIDVGGRVVELIEVGPAHTRGDTIVHCPETKTVYTGDILFIGGAPIVWAGPLENWIAACDLIAALDADVIVPGHGPLTDKAGVAHVRDYLSSVLDGATKMQRDGVDAFEAARELVSMLHGTSKPFSSMGEFGRMTVNVDTVYRSLDPTYQPPNVVEQFRRMAVIEHHAS
jgi:glyoxylase-like metal-dependent hydrolase (beta-lactamase superfamily II)